MTPMNLDRLGKILNWMYYNAPRKELVTMIHMFAIRYYDDIQYYGAKDVIAASKINTSYTAEISKGLRLKKYVSIDTSAPIFPSDQMIKKYNLIEE